MVHMNKRSGPASKERILREATKIFSEHGYEKSSMRMIANAANISIGGLYLYFRNKENLYLTLIKFMINEYTERLREALLEVQDPVGQMRTYIAISLNYAKKHKELLLVKGREFGRSFRKDIKRNFFKRQNDLVEEIIERGITSGVFSECHAKEATKIIRSTIRGFIVSMIIEEDALFSPDECSNLILNGLMRREKQ
jgi:AcrR family transcriptional regulator